MGGFMNLASAFLPGMMGGGMPNFGMKNFGLKPPWMEDSEESEDSEEHICPNKCSNRKKNKISNRRPLSKSVKASMNAHVKRLAKAHEKPKDHLGVRKVPKRKTIFKKTKKTNVDKTSKKLTQANNNIYPSTHSMYSSKSLKSIDVQTETVLPLEQRTSSSMQNDLKSFSQKKDLFLRFLESIQSEVQVPNLTKENETNAAGDSKNQTYAVAIGKNATTAQFKLDKENVDKSISSDSDKSEENVGSKNKQNEISGKQMFVEDNLKSYDNTYDKIVKTNDVANNNVKTPTLTMDTNQNEGNENYLKNSANKSDEKPRKVEDSIRKSIKKAIGKKQRLLVTLTTVDHGKKVSELIKLLKASLRHRTNKSGFVKLYEGKTEEIYFRESPPSPEALEGSKK